MKAMVKKLQVFLNYLTAFLLACMVVIVFINVISRYFFHSSIAWSEEISRFMLIWVVFLGAILAYINDEHLGLDMLVKVLPLGVKRVVLVISDLLVLYAIYLIIRGGYHLMMANWDWLSPAVSLPYAYVYLVVPISGAVLFVQTIFKLARTIKETV